MREERCQFYFFRGPLLGVCSGMTTQATTGKSGRQTRFLEQKSQIATPETKCMTRQASAYNRDHGVKQRFNKLAYRGSRCRNSYQQEKLNRQIEIKFRLLRKRKYTERSVTVWGSKYRRDFR